MCAHTPIYLCVCLCLCLCVYMCIEYEINENSLGNSRREENQGVEGNSSIKYLKCLKFIIIKTCGYDI